MDLEELIEHHRTLRVDGFDDAPHLIAAAVIKATSEQAITIA